MRRSLLLRASLVALAFVLFPAQAPLFAQTGVQPVAAPSASSAKLVNITVTGTSLPSSEVVSASGLSLGEMVTAAQLQAAANQLSAFGLFSNIHYRYTSKGDGLSVEFQLADAPTVPLWFDNLPWLSDDEIDAAIRGDVGMFPGRVPDSGELDDEIDALLQKLLAAKHVQTNVTHQVIASPTDDTMIMEFRATDAALPLQSVEFGDSLAANSEQLKDRIDDVAGQPYSRLSLAVFINEHVRPLYLAQGNLRAQIGPPQANLTIDVQRPTQSAVDVTVPIVPGPVYSWNAVEWQGNSVLASADLDKLTGMMPGDVADGLKIQAGWEHIQSEYGRRGYLDAKVDPQPQFDEGAHRVQYRVNITEGAQYRMGDIVITGLSYESESRLREIWKLGKGEIFDETYFDQMLSLLAKPNAQIFGNRPVHYDQFGHWLRPNPQQHTVDVLLDFK